MGGGATLLRMTKADEPQSAEWRTRLIALTLWPEWAWAVAHLGKRVENRTWAPPRWAMGRRLAIHGGAAFGGHTARVGAGGKVPASWLYAVQAMLDMGLRAGEAAVGPVTMGRLIPEAQSKIVAVGRLSGVVTESADPWFVGPFGWVLSDVVVLPAPVPCRGAQGLWEVPQTEREAVLRQLPSGR